MHLNRLLKTAAFDPTSVQEPNPWVGHMPFASWLIQEVKPEIFVELGTHSGNSYFSFCQSVLEGALQTKCYAVDTWQGDEHSGEYNDEIFAQVNSHNQDNYCRFSTLLKMTFDEAIKVFPDASIELLHIDGLHTYEAVLHDFESWLPKLSPGAIVVFHDTNVFERNFGVWKLWRELQVTYPNNIEFLHSHGLGVLQLNNYLGDQPADFFKLNKLDRDAFITYFSSLGAKQTKHSELNKLNLKIASLTQEVSERDSLLLNEAARIASLTQEVSERDSLLLNEAARIASLTQEVSERDSLLEFKLLQINSIYNSRIYRIMIMFRRIKSILLIGFPHIFRAKFSNFIRKVWRHIPLSEIKKQKIKFSIFTHAPHLFKWTKAFSDFKKLNGSKPRSMSKHIPLDVFDTHIDLRVIETSPIKLIAFFLPQFHEIKENNEWWGNGFTEWTNVRPAKPQFTGHYQPHVAGELGYYDLLDPHTYVRQIELAKLYGIGGFCFYTYWFDGKLLLEKLLVNILDNKNLDFPYCLCWANENWTRRWDGLDNEILIKQNHSPEDDYKFIQYISRFIKDTRYIRVDGKPLILVYRPNILPNPKETSARWRKWCVENGIGEIYLAYTQAFEKVNPDIYGFDAAIEFPPNNTSSINMSDKVDSISDGFNCSVYDWRTLKENSENYINVGYKLFRSVCPSWDNTPRKKNRATIFINNTPQLFEEWVSNALIYTFNNFKKADERLVFINAWNEWGEGAHLEPDLKFGYAYLNAIKRAIVSSNNTLKFLRDNNFLNRRNQNTSKYKKIALVIHAYYLDVFDEILAGVDAILKENSQFFITCTHENRRDVEQLLIAHGVNAKIFASKNKGRDILPFLEILPTVLKSDVSYVIKIHTKKSSHRIDGDAWCKSMVASLLNINLIDAAINSFEKDLNLGIIGPSGHLVPMGFYFGSNEENIKKLSSRLDISMDDVNNLNFVAGSMFFSRREVFEPIINLQLNCDDFEVESGQVDGTYAHAIERLFSVGAYKVGMRVSSQDEQITDNYEFAERT